MYAFDALREFKAKIAALERGSIAPIEKPGVELYDIWRFDITGAGKPIAWGITGDAGSKALKTLKGHTVNRDGGFEIATYELRLQEANNG